MKPIEDIIVCLPGARIEHVTEIVQRIMKRGNVWTSSHRDEQHRHGRNNSDTEEIQESTEEDEGSEGCTDDLIRDFTSVWSQTFEEDGSQRDGEAAVQRTGSGIRRFVG